MCKNIAGMPRFSPFRSRRAPTSTRSMAHVPVLPRAMFRSRGFRGFRPRNSTSQAVHLATLTVIGVVSGKTFVVPYRERKQPRRV